MMITFLRRLTTRSLSNKALVEKVNNSVKEAIEEQEGQEVDSDDHIGVQYTVNFHGLIKKYFDRIWTEIDEDGYKKAEVYYKEKMEDMIEDILKHLKFIKNELQLILESDPGMKRTIDSE